MGRKPRKQAERIPTLGEISTAHMVGTHSHIDGHTPENKPETQPLVNIGKETHISTEVTNTINIRKSEICEPIFSEKKTPKEEEKNKGKEKNFGKN